MKNLKNRIKAVNELNDIINKVMGIYQAELSKGFKVCKDNTLHKKDADRIKAEINKLNIPSHIRCCLMRSDYSMRVWFDIRFDSENGQGYNYYEDSVYFVSSTGGWDKPKVWTLDKIELPIRRQYTEDEVQARLDTINSLEAEKSQIENKISELKHGFYAFIEGR